MLDLSHNQIIKVEEDSLAGLQVDLLDFTSNLMRRLPSSALRNRVELSHWSRYCALIGWILMLLTPALLCHKDTAQDT